MSSLQSIIYSSGNLLVLDQLKLPHEVTYLKVSNSFDAWTVIRSMQVRGAPLIAITAVLGLAVEATNRLLEFTSLSTACGFLIEKINYLRTSRPTAVNLFVATDELLVLVNDFLIENSKTAQEAVLVYIEAAESIYNLDIKTNKAIGSFGAKRILELVGKEKIRVLTICNTGSLATAGYGTALGVVRSLHELGSLEHVFACETRPYNQGSRLTAFEIVHDKLPGTLIADSMASALMSVKGVDCVIVGADRVAANGDTANKIGTFQLAIAAKYHKIPFFVAAPTTTLDLSIASGVEIHVEERPASELTSIFGQKLAPDGIDAWNPSFDVTPFALIKGIITELGVIEAPLSNSDSVEDKIIPIKKFLLSLEESTTTTLNKNLLNRLNISVPPSSLPFGYVRMDETKIGRYIFSNSKLLTILGLKDVEHTETNIENSLKISEVGDGNLNFVYIIESTTTHKSLVVKQALPYVRCVGESWPLTFERAIFETAALREERALLGGRFVPEVYLFDESKALIVMEYIEPPHLILRKSLIQQTKISTFAVDIGVFLGHTLYGTSGIALEGGALRSAVSRWSRNTAMCALTEKVIFTDPYTNSSYNHWTSPQLDKFALGIREDAELKLAAAYHKSLFLTSTQALLHGDLHTGSIMAKEGSTFVIDPEFAFYGPMGFDIGAILSNLFLSFFAHYEQQHVDFSNWLLIQTRILYNTFVDVFLSSWTNDTAKYVATSSSGEIYHNSVFHDAALLKKSQEDFLKSVWRDALGFTGLKIIRRIVGIAHVADLESIEDLTIRSNAEKKAILFARELILFSYNHHNSNNTNDTKKLVVEGETKFRSIDILVDYVVQFASNEHKKVEHIYDV